VDDSERSLPIKSDDWKESKIDCLGKIAQEKGVD
jgi:hypothetical protein